MIRILYVDDDPAHLNMGKCFLEKTGKFSVDTAVSAPDVVGTEKYRQYDAIVADYRMPEMDGLAFLKAIRSTGDRTPFILLTGEGGEAVAVAALKAGADFYLTKNGDVTDLFSRLSQTIDIVVRQHRAGIEAGIRKEAQELSEEQFRELFNNMKRGAAIYEAVDDGADFVFRDFNHTAETIDNISRDEVIGRRVTEVFPVVRKFGLLEVLTRVWKTGNAEQHPVSFYQDGRITGWRENFVYRLPGGEVVATYEDLTARKLEEEELRFKNLILTTEQETSPEAILIVDDKGLVVRYNQKFIHLWGIPKEALAERLDAKFLEHAVARLADPEAFLERVRYLYEHKDEKSYEEIRFKDGRILERFSSPMLGEDGRYYGRVWYFRDITERRQAEDALKKSEEKYRLLADAAKDFIYIIDRDDRVAYVNKYGLSMINRDLEDVVGRPRRDLFPREAAERQYTNLRKVFESGTPLRNESMVPMPGGMTWQDTCLVPLTADDGTVNAVMGVSRDITERKLAEEHLRANEVKLRTYIDNSPVGIFIIDNTQHYIDANKAACAMTGYTREELLTLTVSALAPEEELGEVEEYIRKLRKTGRFSRELPLLKKDGTNVSVILDAVALSEGTAIAFCTDITERKRAEELIRENLERHELILKNANEGIIVNEMAPDGPGKFIEANESACRILGLTFEELLDGNLAEMGGPDLKPRYPEFEKEMMEKHHIIFQTVYRTKNNVEKYLEVSSSFFELAGRPAMLSVFRDITEQKKAELALKHANKKLNLLTGITRHDIRNQLLSLNAYLALSRETLGDPNITKDYIRSEEAITKTIERQILFTREYESLGVDAPFWQNVSDCIGRAAGELDLTGVVLDTREMTNVEIFADSLLQKVFFNLIDNSLRHGGDSMSRIRISNDRIGDELLIRYEDDGVGIPADDKEMIFERGFGKNTGFGLFFIREILAITAITITEDGEPGRGIRFRIMVPKGEYRFVKQQA